jgi:hypothetical protein
MKLTPEQLEIATKLLPIFFPYAARSRDRVIANNSRFVHYTSAENALKIIETKRIWMRNTTCMTDYREVQHGLDALNRYFNNEAQKQAFATALNECNPGVAEEAFGLFNQWWQNTQLQTYITSISEHDDREDLHGRLSMWRAFGGTAARVAIVIKLQLGIGTNLALGAGVSPVGYFTDEDVARELNSVTTNVRANQDFLRGVDRNALIATVFAMLTTAVVCLKHEGFHEEREWRVIHSPKRMPSTHIESSVEVVAGVPQLVYKITLQNKSDAGISGLDPNDLIDRIIIGPTQFSWAMYEAFVAALDAAGVKDAATRVFISQIPVRT